MPTDITDPDLSPAQWAAALDPIELSCQLVRLATDAHRLNAAERQAVLLAAANRLIA